MKGGRQRVSTEIDDFSGGLFTRAAVTRLPPKFSPDCQNVFAEGKYLRKRLGFSPLNSSAVSGNGNGIYYWVKSATQRLLMSFFGSTLYSMDLAGTKWDGTWDTVGQSTAGTAFSDATMHFVTYLGTLIMTTENNDWPQRMTSIESSHFNVDFGGTGTAVLAKYPQVWKTHLWLMNISGGGELTEVCTTLTSWTTADVNTGATTTATFQGNTTFKMYAGATAGDDAVVSRDIGTLPNNYQVEFKTYFDKLGTIANADYAVMNYNNGVVKLETRFSDDGLEIYDGAAWQEIDVNTVSEDTWVTWKYHIMAQASATATINVYKAGVPVALGNVINSGLVASNGKLEFIAEAGASGNRTDWYLDFINVNSINAVKNYATNGDFSTWTAGTAIAPTNWTVYPTNAFTYYRCSDDAASTAVTDDGSGSNDGTASVNTSSLNTTGKIGDGFDFNGTDEEIDVDVVAVATSTDANGSLSLWVNPDAPTTSQKLFYVGDGNSGGGADYFWVGVRSDGKVEIKETVDGTTQFDGYTTTALDSATWTLVSVVQDGTLIKVYLGSREEVMTWDTSTDRAVWFTDLNTVTIGRIASRELGTEDAEFFDGKLDAIIYKQAVMTTAEISAIYNSDDGNEALGSTIREGTTFVQGTYSAEVSADVSGKVFFTQALTSASELAGIESYFGVWVNGTNNMEYVLQAFDGSAIVTSSTFSANAAFQYQTLAFTPVSNATSVDIQVIALTAGTIFVDQAAVVPATAAIASDNADRVQRTATNTYNDFSGTGSGSDDLITSNDVGVTGSFILQDKLYVTKRWSIHRFTYTGSTPLVDIKEIKKTVGTASIRSAVNIDIDEGEVVFFLGTDRKFYLFDGSTSRSISDDIAVDNGLSSFYMENINTQALDKIFAVNHQTLGFVEVFLPLGSATVPTHSIVYDYISKSFWGFDNRNFKSGAVCDNGSGQRVVYAQGSVDGVGYLLNDTNSDNGTNINAYWISPKLANAIILDKFDELQITTSNASVTPIISWRCDWETDWVDKTLATNTNDHNYSPDRIDNLIQLKISDDSSDESFHLWSLELSSRAVGGGK